MAKEYIERNKLIENLTKFAPEQYTKLVNQLITKHPTADVEEVKHGYWIDNFEKTTTVAGITKEFVIGYKCSVCGRKEISKEPYCNCGAKMDNAKNATTTGRSESFEKM